MSQVPLKHAPSSIMNTKRLQNKKLQQQKITMCTCYDFWSAQIIEQTAIDCILVGDSAAMVMHGHNSTVMANVEMLCTHTEAVVKGAPSKFVVADLPFCSYRKGLNNAVSAAEKLMRAGAQAVKLEGATGNLEIISHLQESGIPVVGHLGLTPQSVNTLGGFKVQGRDQQKANKISQDALALQKSGCFALVLECVPETLATSITKELSIPTIGIGAGPHTDGQVLVLQDLLGMNPNFNPKFARQYIHGYDLIKQALQDYHNSVVAREFPAIKEHCF